MSRTPFASKSFYYGTESSNSEWLRRFIIKHNHTPANRIPNWELPRLRLILKILSELENSNLEEVRDILYKFSEEDFSNQKTTIHEVNAELARMGPPPDSEQSNEQLLLDIGDINFLDLVGEIEDFELDDLPIDDDLIEIEIEDSNRYPEINDSLRIEFDSLFGIAIEEFFEWPSTEAEPSWHGLSDLDSSEWPKIGVMKRMGYSVAAKESLTPKRRSEILDYIFQASRLPFVQSYEHMMEWGQAKSVARLKKMANSIASFGRNMRRQKNYNALFNYDTDLDYLKETYYDPFFDDEGFFWPTTDEY
jgi:hypothetical protein